MILLYHSLGRGQGMGVNLVQMGGGWELGRCGSRICVRGEGAKQNFAGIVQWGRGSSKNLGHKNGGRGGGGSSRSAPARTRILSVRTGYMTSTPKH